MLKNLGLVILSCLALAAAIWEFPYRNDSFGKALDCLHKASAQVFLVGCMIHAREVVQNSLELQAAALAGCILILSVQSRDKPKKGPLAWSLLIGAVCNALFNFLRVLGNILDILTRGQGLNVGHEISNWIVSDETIRAVMYMIFAMAIHYLFRSPKRIRQTAQDEAADIIRAAEEKAAAILRAAGKASIEAR